MSWVVVSLHDVASVTAELSRRWMDLFAQRGLRVSVLVVPGPWRGAGPLDVDRPLAAWLRSLQDAGHDIAQHGWTHMEPDSTKRGCAARAAGRLAARGCAEFWHLDHLEASRRIALGRAVMSNCGLRVAGFVAPGWLMSPEARASVAAAGFGYTTTHTAVSDLASGRRWPCPVLTQRPGSAITGPSARTMTHIAEWTVRRRRPLRVAAHPADLADRRSTDAVLRACDAALRADYHSLTYAELVMHAFTVGTGR